MYVDGSRPRGALILAAAVIALFAWAGSGPPALAHDVLLASSPEHGERLEQAPAQIVLTFDNEPLPVGAAIVVIDADDADWARGEPAIDGRDVIIDVDGDIPDSGFEVRWRVVSSDGHPISGLIPFTIGDGDEYVRPGTPSPAEPASAGGQADPAMAGDDDGGASPARTVVVGAGGAAAAASVFVLYLVLTRRSRDAH